MNDWAIFTNLYQSFNAPFLATINAQSTQLAREVMPVAMLAATIYIGVIFSMDLLSGGGGNPILDLVRRAGRTALILSCLGAGVLVGTINNLLLVTLPAGLTAAVGGGLPVGAAIFDHLAGQVWTTCAQVWNNMSFTAPKTWMPGVFACLYLIDGILAVSLCATLWIITQVGLGVTVAVGPLAIACLLNPQTARFFNGWLSTVITFIVAQVMFVTIFSILIVTVNTTLAHILATNAAGVADGDDIGGQIHQMVNAGLMFTVAAITALSAIPIARAIGGGAGPELYAATRWATSKMGMATGATGGTVAAAPANARAALGPSSAAGMRNITPAGRA